MFEGHDLYLVVLSLAIAILGGYNGFALAARIRRRPDADRRVLLAGAAGFLAVGIWTMHFIGMLAAPLPPDTAFLVLPTIISFLICALVVGVSLYFVSIGVPSWQRLAGSAVLLGVGISSMHYVGMHGLAGPFEMTHDPVFVTLSALIAIGAAYGGLRAFIAGQGGAPLLVSAAGFGVAVSGMHYTAMFGLHLIPPTGTHYHAHGLVASQQLLSLVVALFCFFIAAGFLLLQVPDPRERKADSASRVIDPSISPETAPPDDVTMLEPVRRGLSPRSSTPETSAANVDGLEMPRRIAASRFPIEGTDGILFIDVADVRSIRADAHYTRIHDGTRERMCPWSISEAEMQLDSDLFLRVHRRHIVSLSHVVAVRREGDGAVIELDGAVSPRVPVSRAKVAEVKARLGLIRRSA